jgi:transcriptional regulator with XRE-family HTH domain
MAKSVQNPSQLRIGQAVRARRSELGMSLATLAGDLGIATSSLSKLENGLTPITFERLERLSRLLDVDMGVLLGGASLRHRADDGANGTEERPPQGFGARRTVTRAGAEQAVEGGVYTLLFHATDLLEKKFQPVIAEVLCTDIKDYGPYTRHDGEEFNYVLSGTLDFHTDVYGPVRLEAGDSIYFDAEMGHAHIRVGDEPCRLLGMITPRTARNVRNGVAAAMEITRTEDTANQDGATQRNGLRI